MQKQLTITRTAELQFRVLSGMNTYSVARLGGRWQCDCPARGMCKHIRTVLGSVGLSIGGTIVLAPNTDSSHDDGLLGPAEFDAEAGRDTCAEIEYIRSGREKQNYGC